MQDFNFVDQAVKSYRFVWGARSFLLRLAFWPFVLKAISFMIIILAGLETNGLRQGLVLLPSAALEGLMVIYAIRFALDSPGGLNAARPPALRLDVDRTVTACTVIYVLIKMLTSLMAAFMMEVSRVPAPEPAQPPNGATFIVALFFLAIMVSSFRLFWVYIAPAAGMTFRGYMTLTRPFFVSVSMLAFWLLAVMPIFMVLAFFSGFFSGLFPGPAPEIASLPYGLSMAVVQAAAEIFVGLATNIGMAQALMTLAGKKTPPRR